MELMRKYIECERNCVKLCLRKFPDCSAGRWAGSKGPREANYTNSAPVDVTMFWNGEVYHIQVKYKLDILSNKERRALRAYCARMGHIPLLSDGNQIYYCGPSSADDRLFE